MMSPLCQLPISITTIDVPEGVKEGGGWGYPYLSRWKVWTFFALLRCPRQKKQTCRSRTSAAPLIFLYAYRHSPEWYFTDKQYKDESLIQRVNNLKFSLFLTAGCLWCVWKSRCWLFLSLQFRVHWNSAPAVSQTAKHNAGQKGK